MLSERVCIKPDLSTADMAMLKNFGLVFDGNLIPFANLFEIARLLWLGAFFVVKQKKEQYFLERSKGNKSPIGVPSLQRSRPAFLKSFEPAPALSFGFLEILSRAGVPGGDASDLVFSAAERSSLPITIMLETLWFGLESLGVNEGTESG